MPSRPWSQRLVPVPRLGPDPDLRLGAGGSRRPAASAARPAAEPRRLPARGLASWLDPRPQPRVPGCTCGQRAGQGGARVPFDLSNEAGSLFRRGSLRRHTRLPLRSALCPRDAAPSSLRLDEWQQSAKDGTRLSLSGCFACSSRDAAPSSLSRQQSAIEPLSQAFVSQQQSAHTNTRHTSSPEQVSRSDRDRRHRPAGPGCDAH